MSKDKGRSIRITISEEAYDEYQILSIRSKKSSHDIIVDIVERYIDKKKDKASLPE